MNQSKYYIYRHIRKDKNEPFYIGIGTKQNRHQHSCFTAEYSRAYSKARRNAHWHNIIKKTEYEVEILMESDNYEFIKQKEIEFIELYSETLSNLTRGGEGTIGYKHTDEAKDKLRRVPHLSLGNHPCAKPTFMYSLNGEYLGKFDSQTEASLLTSTRLTKIQDCVSGHSKRGGDYIWRKQYLGEKILPFTLRLKKV